MTPKISIIIPMFNTEKYIAECLDSILAQTFTDFEVIIIDDCSTDKSCEVVESYLPIFNKNNIEKLRLIRFEKNSGGHPGVLRNIGIKLAHGKYVCFVDSDDALTETALEELYTLAEDFQAEVVHCEKYFMVADKDFTTDKNFLTADAQLKADFVINPAFMTTNLDERIENFVDKKFDWSTCTNFIRRDFLVKHDLKFPPIINCEDSILAIYFLCLAEKILCVPNVVYIYRQRKDSLSKPRSLSEEKFIQNYCNMIFYELSSLYKFFNNNKIFEDEPLNRWRVFDFFINWHLPYLFKAFTKDSIAEVDEFIRNEIEKFDDKVTLATTFFEYASLFLQKINSLNEYLQELNRNMNYRRVQVQNLKSVLSNRDATNLLTFLS